MTHELHVRNFPFDASARDLRIFLGEQFIKDVRIIRDRRTKKSKGYAFVTANSSQDATIVKQKNGEIMGGRNIRISDSKKELKKKGGSRELRKVVCRNIMVGMWKTKDIINVKDFPGEELGIIEQIKKNYPSIKDNPNCPSLYTMIEAGKILVEHNERMEQLLGDFFGNGYFINEANTIEISRKRIRLSIIHKNRKYYLDFYFYFIELMWKKNQKLMISTSYPPPIYEVRTFENQYYFETKEIRTTDISESNFLKNHKLFVFEFTKENFREMEKKVYLAQTSNFSYDSELMSVSSDYIFSKDPKSELIDIYKRIKSLSKRFPEIGYYIHACISERWLNPFYISNDFLLELSKNEQESVEFLYDLYYYGSIEEIGCYDEIMLFTTQPLLFFENWRRRKKKKKKNHEYEEEPTDLLKIKRILVTPCSIYFVPEELDIGNSVLRKFSKYQKRFVRVSFVDEIQREMKIRHTEPISKRILYYLTHGIKVGGGGGYHFKFLAFSNSQLRGGSLWMFHEDLDCNCKTIRRWMGDFSSIKILAKFCARLGQCLSTTRSTIDLRKEDFIVAEDIKTYDGKYIFTDGCGLISASFAKKVVKKLNLKEFRGTDLLPGAFQIRFNGAKGVLAVYPDSHFLLGYRKIVLRKSQMKFKCITQYNVGVIRYSNFRPCYLNRQVIALLSTRGIQDHVFLDHQKRMITMLEYMFHDNNITIEVLSKFSSNNELSKILTQYLKSGFPLSDLFFQNCLKSISKYKRIDLQQKSKIYIEHGSLMIGVCDESRKLRYGEVFVRIQVVKNGVVVKSYIHQGPVVVSKNPAFHPGDIRVLMAVDIPDLRHLSNVIVFPVSGHRDHPNEISGSDLDGDIYFVTWEKSLIPITPNFKPMDYTPPPPKTINHKVSLRDISKFFVDSLKNDQLGRIANAHLAHYAFAEDKCMDVNCKILAGLHSIAVDFPKTGVPAELSFDLIPQKYPLFMEKVKKRKIKTFTKIKLCN